MWLLLLSAIASAASFEGSVDFRTDRYQGELHVQCSGPQLPNFTSTSCAEDSLEPFAFAKFQTEPIDADEVRLKSHRADGKLVEKSGEMDGATGRSKKRFNLWIETLLQTALLDVGDNTVEYELLKNGQVVKAGQFKATVRLGKVFQCSRETIFSNDPNDCMFPGRTCDSYFGRARCWE